MSDEQQYYPIVSDKLIKALRVDFPDALPKGYVSDFDLGVLIGQQQVIDKLLFEKERSEDRDLEI